MLVSITVNGTDSSFNAFEHRKIEKVFDLNNSIDFNYQN